MGAGPSWRSGARGWGQVGGRSGGGGRKRKISEEGGSPKLTRHHIHVPNMGKANEPAMEYSVVRIQFWRIGLFTFVPFCI